MLYRVVWETVEAVVATVLLYPPFDGGAGVRRQGQC